MHRTVKQVYQSGVNPRFIANKLLDYIFKIKSQIIKSNKFVFGHTRQNWCLSKRSRETLLKVRPGFFAATHRVIKQNITCCRELLLPNISHRISMMFFFINHPSCQNLCPTNLPLPYPNPSFPSPPPTSLVLQNTATVKCSEITV